MDRLKQIGPLHKESMDAASLQWNHIVKPLHSLGLLEEQIIQIAGISGNHNVRLSKRCVLVFCADNGVVCEGVTQSESDVTAKVAKTMITGSSNINLMADVYHTDVCTIDVGMLEDISPDYKAYNRQDHMPPFLNKKVAYGTGNIAREPAMSIEQAKAAIRIGMDAVGMCKELDYDIIVTGEMGIGNTTTQAALAAVLLQKPAMEVTGKGAGLSDRDLLHKMEIVEKSVKRYERECALSGLDKHNPDPVFLLSQLGGYDIASMVGAFLGGAVYGIPIVIDGVISAVAANIAACICPLCQDYMLPSHVSKEPAGKFLLDKLKKKPLIQAELHLGEGSGGVCLLPMLDGALAVYHSSHRFETMGLERYQEL